MGQNAAENGDDFVSQVDSPADWEDADLPPLGDELLAGFLPDDDEEPLPERGDFWWDDSCEE